MFDVEYGDLSASAIASRLGPEPKRNKICWGNKI